MNQYQGMVRQFHFATGSTIGHTPEIRDAELRAALIFEEAKETIEALRSGDEVEVIDGLCDLLYVTFGTAVAMGVDLDPFFAEVHNSNMSKLGGEKREDGKVLKPEGYRPPDIKGLLERERRWGESPAHANHEQRLWDPFRG